MNEFEEVTYTGIVSRTVVVKVLLRLHPSGLVRSNNVSAHCQRVGKCYQTRRVEGVDSVS